MLLSNLCFIVAIGSAPAHHGLELHAVSTIHGAPSTAADELSLPMSESEGNSYDKVRKHRRRQRVAKAIRVSQVIAELVRSARVSVPLQFTWTNLLDVEADLPGTINVRFCRGPPLVA